VLSQQLLLQVELERLQAVQEANFVELQGKAHGLELCKCAWRREKRVLGLLDVRHLREGEVLPQLLLKKRLVIR
jgi:hypothetical protein